MDQSVRSCIALVFRQIEADGTAGDRHEQRQSRLELVLPLLSEAQTLVPLDGASSVPYVEDRNDLLLHLSEPNASPAPALELHLRSERRTNASTGSDLPFTASGGSRSRTAPAGSALAVPDPTTTCPASACASRRAARLTVSPTTPCFRWPVGRPTTPARTSPLWTPTRKRGQPGCSSASLAAAC